MQIKRQEPLAAPPSASDEASRFAAEDELKKRGKGRQTTILTQARRMGLPAPAAPANKPTILGS